MDYKKIKQNLESGESRSSQVSDAPFPEYGEPVVSSKEKQSDPFPEYREEVYTKDEHKKVENYGGTTRVFQDVDQLKCPMCGASLRYDADKGVLICDYCGNMQKILSGAAVERELELGQDTSQKWREETRVYRCANCGATSVFAKGQLATKCPFCDSPSVVDVHDIEGVRPNAVIPFSIGEENARLSYRKWIKKRAYAVGVFKKKKSSKVDGVYTPAWTYDSKTYSNFDAVVGDYYTVTVGSGKNRHTETRVRYRNVRGNFMKDFDDVTVHAGAQMSEKAYEKVSPFPTRKAVSYTSAYLSGYSAEHYTTTLTSGWQTAQEKMRSAIHDGISQQLQRSCDVIQSINMQTQFSNNTFKYVLLPIYVCHREFKGKNYLGFVNGVTGSVYGLYPKSKPKIISTVFGVLIGIAGVVVGILAALGILF